MKKQITNLCAIFNTWRALCSKLEMLGLYQTEIARDGKMPSQILVADLLTSLLCFKSKCEVINLSLKSLLAKYFDMFLARIKMTCSTNST